MTQQPSDAPSGAPPSPLERLKREPERFSLDQAAAVLAPGRDPSDLAFRTTARLSYPAGDVTRVDAATHEIVTPTVGLIGPGGVLPRYYSGRVEADLKQRSGSLHAFLDMLSRRFVGLFVRAGAKYRPTRDPRLAEGVLSAVIGIGTPRLAASLGTQTPAVLYHAGAIAPRTRSAERLRGMVAEEIEARVEIQEFSGGWVRIPTSEQSRLARGVDRGHFVRLGIDAAVGTQVWDPSSRFTVALGPVSLATYLALLPGQPLHARLVELTRLQVGIELDFLLRPILRAGDVPPLRLRKAGDISARLGWTSWLNAPRPRRRDCDDALLRTDLNTLRRSS